MVHYKVIFNLQDGCITRKPLAHNFGLLCLSKRLLWGALGYMAFQVGLNKNCQHHVEVCLRYLIPYMAILGI